MTRRMRRGLILLAAYAVLLGLVFQIAALDHWGPTSIEDVEGIEHTHFHATHCHGAAGGCADGGGALSWASAAPAGVPLPPAARLDAAPGADLSPAEAPVFEPLHPPRHA